MTQEPKQPAPKQPAPDLLGDFQRWLMKSSARGLGHQVRGNVRKTMGYGGSKAEDVWSVATSEVPEEPPECEWCPVCRAARKFRDSGRGPGLGSHLSSAGDAFASVLNDAVSAFETAVSSAKQPPGSGPAARPAEPRAGAGTAQATAPAPAPPGAAAAPGTAGAGTGTAGTGTAAGPETGAAGPGAAGTRKPGPKTAGGAAGAKTAGAKTAGAKAAGAKAAGAKAAAGAGTGRPAAVGPKRSAGTTAGTSAGTGAKAPGRSKPRKPSAGTAKPGAGTAKPGAGTAKPGAGTTKPGAGPTGPGAGAWAEAADPVTRATKRPPAGGTREGAVDDPDDRG